MSYQGTQNGSVQTGYFDNFSEGYAGQIASLADPKLIDGFPAQVDFGVGLGVVEGTALSLTAGKYNNLNAPYGVVLPDAGTIEADFVGIVIRENASKNDTNGNPIVENLDMASVMRKGRVFVNTNVAITAGDPVFLIIKDTIAHGFPVGSFHNTALTANAVAITKATFWKTAPVNDVAIIEIDY